MRRSSILHKDIHAGILIETDELFSNLFKISAVKRTKKDGLVRKINFIHTKS